MVAISPQGTFTWAPGPDGLFVSALPGTLLAQGSFDKSIKIMTAFNHNVTEFFTSRDNVNSAVFVDNIKATFPGAQNWIFGVSYPIEGQGATIIKNGSSIYHRMMT